MKTLFLDWQKLGDLWSAKDPINPNLRWIIQPGLGHRWSLSWVLNSNKRWIYSSNSLEMLQLKAVTSMMDEINDRVHNNPHLIDNKELGTKMMEFLNQFYVKGINETTDIKINADKAAL